VNKQSAGFEPMIAGPFAHSQKAALRFEDRHDGIRTRMGRRGSVGGCRHLDRLALLKTPGSRAVQRYRGVLGQCQMDGQEMPLDALHRSRRWPPRPPALQDSALPDHGTAPVRCAAASQRERRNPAFHRCPPPGCGCRCLSSSALPDGAVQRTAARPAVHGSPPDGVADPRSARLEPVRAGVARHA